MDSEVLYNIEFEISNHSYPGINVHIVSFGGLGGYGCWVKYVRSGSQEWSECNSM